VLESGDDSIFACRDITIAASFTSRTFSARKRLTDVQLKIEYNVMGGIHIDCDEEAGSGLAQWL